MTKKIVHNHCRFQLASCVRLRSEHFGGFVYDSRNGNTLEVDQEAFQLLSSIKGKARESGI